jgi:hypothetical protein
MKTITITLPSESWRWEPESHIIDFDDILGWLVRRVGGNASMSITEEDAKYALESWEMARNEGWIVAQPPTKDLQDIIAMTDPDSWIEEANCSTEK